MSDRLVVRGGRSNFHKSARIAIGESSATQAPRFRFVSHDVADALRSGAGEDALPDSGGTPQLPSTTLGDAEVDGNRHQEIASFSLRPLVVMTKWRIFRKTSLIARSTEDFW
jgi:hypothetical protein